MQTASSPTAAALATDTGLLARPEVIGEAYTITGDEVLTWDAIFTALARAAGVESPQLVHIASEALARELPEWGPGLLGDKAHSVVFDCSKVRALRGGFAQRVPFVRGAEQIVAAFDAHPELQDYDPALDVRMDELVARYGG